MSTLAATTTGILAKPANRRRPEARVKIIAVRNRVKIMMFGQAGEIGLGGMTLYCSQPLELEERVQLEFEWRDRAIKLFAVVRTASDKRCELRFIALTPFQNRELAAICPVEEPAAMPVSRH